MSSNAVLRYIVLPKTVGEGAFAVNPARFDFPLNAVISIFEDNIQNHYQYFSWIPKTWGRYQEHLDTLSLLDWLYWQRDSGENIVEWDTVRRDLIWCYATKLVFRGEFTHVICPICEVNYFPADCLTETWQAGDHPLGMSGGRKFSCPRGHLLYGSNDWNS